MESTPPETARSTCGNSAPLDRDSSSPISSRNVRSTILKRAGGWERAMERGRASSAELELFAKFETAEGRKLEAAVRRRWIAVSAALGLRHVVSAMFASEA